MTTGLLWSPLFPSFAPTEFEARRRDHQAPETSARPGVSASYLRPCSGRVMARSLKLGRFVPTELAMSIKRLRRRPSQATVPPPSLKFRTLGSPEYGFKSRRLIGQPCPAQKNRRLKRQVRVPHKPPGLTQPSSPWRRPALLRKSVLSTAQASGPSSHHLVPTGPSLREGFVVPRLIATTSRSVNLEVSR